MKNTPIRIFVPTVLGCVALAGGAFAQSAPSTATNAPSAQPCPHPTAAQRAAARRRAQAAREAREAREQAQADQLAAAQQSLTQERAAAAARASQDATQIASLQQSVDTLRNAYSQRNAQALDAEARAARAEQTSREEAVLLRQRRARGGGPGWFQPRLAVGVEGGVGAWTEDFHFDNGIGRGAWAGPSWGARLGADLLPWLGVDARYLGFYNNGVDARTNGASLVTNAGLATVRLIAPIPFVHPYIFSGIGVYGTSVVGSATDRQTTNLRANLSPGVPFGVGVEVPVGRVLTLGGEATYHRLFGETFSTHEDIAGGDPVTLNGVVRFRM
jgi:hypothetical protein